MKFTKNAYFENLSQISVDFLENAKWKRYELTELLDLSGQNKGVIKSALTHTPEYGNREEIQFPIDEGKGMLTGAFEARASERTFASEGITFTKLASLLRRSYYIVKRKEGRVRFNIASAGAMYPTEIYFLNKSVKGLKPGVYHYNAYNETLGTIPNTIEDNWNQTLDQIMAADIRNDIDFKNASGIIVFGSVLNRLTVKYNDRGLRYAFFDIGAILNNMYLNAAELGIGICANGGFVDDELNSLLHLKDRTQAALLTAVIGKINENE